MKHLLLLALAAASVTSLSSCTYNIRKPGDGVSRAYAYRTGPVHSHGPYYGSIGFYDGVVVKD